MEEETHRKLENMADELLKDPSDKKRVRKQKSKLSSHSESFTEQNSDYAICLKYNQLSNQQLSIKNNVL